MKPRNIEKILEIALIALTLTVAAFLCYSFRYEWRLCRIEPGQVWEIDESDGNPFKSSEKSTYEVLAVKEGWVQYRQVEYGDIDSARISSFALIRKRIK